MGKSGIVFDIRKYSIHDGPGIRTTVFFKGCPLRCPWCHNPEGMAPAQELIYRENLCIACGLCVGACPQGAVSIIGGAAATSRSLCTLCGACTRACPTGAREIIGRTLTAVEVLTEAEQDSVFYEESEGGVTFSGGEPLMQPDLLLELLQASREKGLHTALDTSGYTAADVLERISPYVDLFLYDLKFMDTERHRRHTGVPNEVILANLKTLSEKGCAIVIRVPIVPGVTDDYDNIGRIGAFAAALRSPPHLALLPYHGAGVEKYARLGKAPPIENIDPPPSERMMDIKAALEALDLTVTVGG